VERSSSGRTVGSYPTASAIRPISCSWSWAGRTRRPSFPRIYDLRTNQHFTLKTNTLRRTDLDDFVESYRPGRRQERIETARFRRFSYDELVARDKASLDTFWLRDESLEDTDNLPSPGVIAAEIVEDLEAALAEFAELAESLQGIGLDVDGSEI
jgi:type I restriction enzyme M protein